MYYQVVNTNVRILGSIHLFPVDRPTVPDFVEDALAWSQAVVLEADSTQALSSMSAPPGGTARELLSQRAWSTIVRLWPSEAHVRPEPLKPWAALLIGAALQLRRVNGVEARATNEGKPLQYLESGGEMAACASSIPLDAIERGIDALVQRLPDADRLFHDLHDAWLRRDVAEIARIGEASPLFAEPACRAGLLDMRNRLWEPRIRGLLKAQSKVLIIVGAMHLCGAGSLVQLLSDLELRTVD